MRPGAQMGGAGHDSGSWLALLFLLLAVLVPTAYVLWVMNEAVNTQREVARQRLMQSYRSQLALVRDRVDSFWEKRGADLDRLAAGGTAAVMFERVVRLGSADAVICLNKDGSVAYPSVNIRMAANPVERRSDWVEARALESRRDNLASAAAAYARIADAEKDDSLAARAVQAQVRCLRQAGDAEGALRVIRQRFASGPPARGTDLEGRLIAADAQLLALHLMKRGDRSYLESARRLHNLLADYSNGHLPSAQRLFLMSQLSLLGFGPEIGDCPTYNAERLAAEFLEADHPRRGDPVLRLSAAPDVWKLTAPSGALIALYRSRTAIAAMDRFLNEQNASNDVAFGALPPGAVGHAYDEWTPAGRMLPGWQITLSLKGGKSFEDIARRQMASYVWLGFLVIATMAVMAVVAGRAFRRQARLASLKTDLVAAVSHELKTPLASMRVLVDALLADAQFDAQKVREYLQLMVGENMRLSRLIENFLTFSRIERNRQKFEFADHKPSDVTLSAVQIMRERYPMPENQPEVDISPGLPLVHVDKDALVTALLNLLDNAYKYTPGDKRISVRTFREDGQVVFAVQDNGIGIAAREQKRIFRRFYQVDQRLARETGGCGLGLSIVEFIVKAHGGAVRVNSEPGAGSMFSVWLPCGEAQGRAA